MPRIVALIFVVLLLWSSTHAQDPGDIGVFNTASSAHLSAMETYRSDRSQNAIDELLRTARELLLAGARLHPSNDERLAELEVLYGYALLQAGRAEDARDYAASALTTLEAHYGKDSESLVTAIILLADTRAEIRNSYAQRKLYKRALRIRAKKYGKSSIEYADLELKAGQSILELSHDISAARDHMREARSVYGDLLGPSDMRAGSVALSLAMLEYGDRRYKRAQRYLLEALERLDSDNPNTRDEHLFARALLVEAYEMQGESDMATAHCIAIGHLTTLSKDQDLGPIFRMAPEYPRHLVMRGSEGAVELSFSVDEKGFVRSPKVLSLEGDKAFANAALDAARRFRYAPRIVNGKPVLTENLHTTITFRIE